MRSLIVNSGRHHGVVVVEQRRQVDDVLWVGLIFCKKASILDIHLSLYDRHLSRSPPEHHKSPSTPLSRTITIDPEQPNNSIHRPNPKSDIYQILNTAPTKEE